MTKLIRWGKPILIVLAFCSFGLIAAEPEVVEKTAEVVAENGNGGGLFGGMGWKEIAIFGFGMLGMNLVRWIAGWLDGKGAKFVQERLEKLQEKIDQNSVMSQIAADNAVTGIIQDSIPELFAEASATLKQDAKDGKFDSDEWKLFHERLWSRVKPHVEGGKNDYIKNSSFEDGQAVVKMVVEKWFKKKKSEKEE